MRYLFLVASVALLPVVACDPVRTHTALATPTGVERTVGPGETVFRIEKTRDLPNAYGGADIYGRKTEAGYTELRFVGMTGESTVVFELLEVEQSTNATTVTEHNKTPGSIATSSHGTRLEVDIAVESALRRSDVTVHILRATKASLTYRLAPAGEPSSAPPPPATTSEKQENTDGWQQVQGEAYSYRVPSKWKKHKSTVGGKPAVAYERADRLQSAFVTTVSDVKDPRASLVASHPDAQIKAAKIGDRAGFVVRLLREDGFVSAAAVLDDTSLYVLSCIDYEQDAQSPICKQVLASFRVE